MGGSPRSGPPLARRELDGSRRHHKQSAIRGCGESSVDRAQHVAEAPGQLVHRHNAKADLVTHDDATTAVQFLHDRVRSGIDVRSVSALPEQIRHPQGQAIDDEEITTYSRLYCYDEIQRSLDCFPRS